MKPSLLSTSSTRSRCLEPGTETFGFERICALRMRVIMSPIGSLMDIRRSSSPARLDQAWDQPLGAEFAQRNARQPVLTVVAARPAGQLAAVADARGRRIAWQLGELERRRKTLLHRQFLVTGNRLEPRATAGELLHQAASVLVLLDRARLGHAYCSLQSRV